MCIGRLNHARLLQGDRFRQSYQATAVRAAANIDLTASGSPGADTT